MKFAGAKVDLDLYIRKGRELIIFDFIFAKRVGAASGLFHTGGTYFSVYIYIISPTNILQMPSFSFNMVKPVWGS